MNKIDRLVSFLVEPPLNKEELVEYQKYLGTLDSNDLPIGHIRNFKCLIEGNLIGKTTEIHNSLIVGWSTYDIKKAKWGKFI